MLNGGPAPIYADARSAGGIPLHFRKKHGDVPVSVETARAMIGAYWPESGTPDPRTISNASSMSILSSRMS